MGRVTQGVKVMRMNENDKFVDLARVVSKRKNKIIVISCK